MKKLKEKHLKGTVPGTNRLFEDLTKDELKEFENNKGFAHFFEDEKEAKRGRPAKEKETK